MIIAMPRATPFNKLAYPTSSSPSSKASTLVAIERLGETSTLWSQQGPSTCGFLPSTGTTLTSGVTCAAGSTCAIDALYSALGCCTQVPCVIPTTCMNSAAVATSCDSLCSSNPYILKCTASGLENCATLEGSWSAMQGSSLMCSTSSWNGYYYPFSTYNTGANTVTSFLPEPSAFNLTSNWTNSNSGTSSGDISVHIAIPIGTVALIVVAVAAWLWWYCRCPCFCCTRRDEYQQISSQPSPRPVPKKGRPEEHEMHDQRGNRHHSSQGPNISSHHTRGDAPHGTPHGTRRPSPRTHGGKPVRHPSAHGRGHGHDGK
ncbi:hypothetical protein V8E51_016026 [Hyaloscypha variabilis]